MNFPFGTNGKFIILGVSKFMDIDGKCGWIIGGGPPKLFGPRSSYACGDGFNDGSQHTF